MKCPLERPVPRARIDLKKQPENGFTLVELIVVLCIIAILLVMTGPSFYTYLSNTGLKQAAYQLSGDLYRAKSKAIRTQKVQTVTLDQGANTYACKNPDRTINLADFRGDTTFTDNPGDKTGDLFSEEITFDARGLSKATKQAYLTANDKTFRVQVSAAGAVSIHEWRDGKWIQ
jgi:prepilin-type N-terminal cleavage/methylation domain-containing protein